VISLRPRSFGEVLDAGISLAFRNLVRLAIVYGLVYVTLEILNYFVAPSVHASCARVAGWGHAVRLELPPQPCGQSQDPKASPIGAVAALIYPVGLSALLVASADAAFGLPIDVWNSYRVAIRKSVKIFGVWLILILALVPLSIPAVVLMRSSRLMQMGYGGPVFDFAQGFVILPAAYAMMAVLYENRGFWEALGLGRRRAFGTGSAWRRSLAVIAFFVALNLVDSFIVDLINGGTFLWLHSAILSLVLKVLHDLIFWPLIASVTVALWIDARVRQDGLDLELVAQQSGATA
jgi:hypothetical protein